MHLCAGGCTCSPTALPVPSHMPGAFSVTIPVPTPPHGHCPVQFDNKVRLLSTGTRSPLAHDQLLLLWFD